MDDLFRRGRAWARVLKTLALMVLPLPLFAAALLALVTGDLARLSIVSAAITAFGVAAVLTWRALAAEARFYLGERLDPPRFPLRLFAAGLTAAGAALGAMAAEHEPLGVGLLALMAGAGYLCFVGLDPRPRRFRVATSAGVDVTDVTRQLKKAYGRLLGIEQAAHSIAVPEFRRRLGRIIDIGRQILSEIEQDPKDASRARRFLNIYLDSAERVTAEYARTHRQLRNQPLEDNFRRLLIDMEQNFADQHRKLLESDVEALDVDIEVLATRLRNEGIH